MAQRRRLKRNFLSRQHPRQMIHNRRLRHLLQVELQAARQHRDRNLLRIGGRQNELDMRRRLFQRFQHRIERMAGKLMDFVDHIHLVAARRRRIGCPLQQLRHVIHAAVRGGIQLDVIHKAAAVDFDARRTHAAGRRSHASFAIQRLGHDARQCRLAHPARAGEQIRMVQAVLFQRVRQCAHNMFLSHQRGKGFWAPFAGENLITHILILPSPPQAGKRRGSSHWNWHKTTLATGHAKTGAASLIPGTCRKRLWLLPSGPDQVHHSTMRGDPPRCEF